MSTSLPFFEIQFPPFMAGQRGAIGAWLKQVDMRLQLANVTEEKDKFKHLIAALPSEIIIWVNDLIAKEPEKNPYTVLTERIKAIEADCEPQMSNRLGSASLGYNYGYRSNFESEMDNRFRSTSFESSFGYGFGPGSTFEAHQMRNRSGSTSSGSSLGSAAEQFNAETSEHSDVLDVFFS